MSWRFVKDTHITSEDCRPVRFLSTWDASDGKFGSVPTECTIFKRGDYLIVSKSGSLIPEIVGSYPYSPHELDHKYLSLGTSLVEIRSGTKLIFDGELGWKIEWGVRFI